MASPSSFAPSPVTPSRSKKRFTLEQANRTLPLVSRIVRDIVATHQHVAANQPQKTTGKQLKADKNAKAANDKSNDAQVDRLQGFVDELSSVGAELKDYSVGLIDFVGRHKGHDVYLCWKLGEDSINYWHEMHAGFAGRQPISQLDERE